MPDEIKTALSFIAGRVTVTLPNGFSRSDDDRVTIYANSTQSTKQISHKVDSHASGLAYQLAVPPGEWEIWAKLGLIDSEKQRVMVEAGQITKLDFTFAVESRPQIQKP